MTLALLQQAAPAPGGLGSTLTGFLPILFVFAIFYFILLAPMRKQQKKTKAMLAALKKGDEVMTSGGIRGTIRRIEEPWLSVQIAENVTVRMARSAITGLIEEGQAPKETGG